MAITLTFKQWVITKADSIAEARGVSVEDIATEPGALQTQVARARQHAVVMDELKADAKSWVLKAKAAAIQDARRKYADYATDERKAMAESDTDYLLALKIFGDIAATASALKSMHFEILNDRRTRDGN